MIKKLFTFLCLCTLCIGSAWGGTASKAWNLTSSSQDWKANGNETYFSQPYGYKKAGGTLKNANVADFTDCATGGKTITSIKVGFKGLRNGATASKITISLVDKDGNILTSGSELELTNASAASNTSYVYSTFTTGLTGATGFMMKVTTLGKNVLINAATYYIEYKDADAPELTSIAVSGTPTKTTYEAGESFDPAGLTVTGTYSDNSTAEITDGIIWDITPSGALTAGTTSVSVTATVGDITSAAYQVNGLTVTATLPKITITDAQVADFTTSYKEYTWTASDVSGKMFAYKTNGMQFNTSKDGYYVYNTDPIPGNIRSIKMTTHNSGTEREWKVSVGTAQITSISGDAGTEPTKKVEKTGTTWTITGNNQYFCLVDKSGASNISEIVITYEEDKTPTIEADIEEIAFEQKELSGTATDSKTISATGKNLTAAISASMKSGSAAVFSVTPVGTPTTAAGKFTVSYSTTVAGKYAGTVVLSSGETSIEIPVSASVVEHIPVLISIAVSGTPTKTEYNEGESFDPAGLVVTGTYDVGEPQVITEGIEWVIDPETFETAGTVSVEVLASVGSITSEVYTVDNIKVVEIPYIFYESFNQTSGTGGNDNQWSGQIASNTLASDNEGWSFSNEGGADKCAKFGAGSKKGSAITPALGYTGNAVISFKAAAWDGSSEGTTLNISVEGGGTAGSSSVTLVKGAWTAYQVSLSNLTSESKIKFEAANASNNRFFLDEIMIVKANASKDVVISEAGWATVCLPFKATITSGNATAYYVTGTEGNALTKEEASVIPAGEGILLKSNDGGEATVTFTISDADAEATDNMMVGSLTDKTFNEENTTYYILTLGNDDKVGFYWDWETNNRGASAKCPAGKAVLAVPATTSGAKAFFSLDDEPTGIKDVQGSKLNVQAPAYNLNGIRVNENYKGIVIMDGKKYINK